LQSSSSRTGEESPKHLFGAPEQSIPMNEEAKGSFDSGTFIPTVGVGWGVCPTQAKEIFLSERGWPALCSICRVEGQS
jgi:exo-beta-1,3-glucanase (GH17 family)